MYITVQLLNGFKKPLTYKISQCENNVSLVGRIVEIPLKTYTTYGLVVAQQHTLSHEPMYTIREINSFTQFPEDTHYFTFLQTIAQHHQIDSYTLLKRLQSFIKDAKNITTPAPHTHSTTSSPVILTQEQQHIVQQISPHITSGNYTPAVLHGVTSSGKTEVYKKLMSHAHTQHKSSIIVLPEVTLAMRFEQIFRTSLSNIPIYSFHSASTPKEKQQLWQALLQKKACIVIGVHLPILLPINNLGLIIVDEEHEHGYQEKKYPKLHTKECALLRAHEYKVPIILGSATPSLTSLHNVKTRGWHYFTLTKRFSGAFPTISVVSLMEHKAIRKNFWISHELELAIRERLAKKEQSIIFLNRRGFSFFIQCAQCAHIPYCPQCSVSLTLHEDHTLRCHYCNTTLPTPQKCPMCTHDKIIKKGIGTQQVVSILSKIFPTAVIARADLDTTTKKKLWAHTIQQVQDGTIDILVGTQTITKGYHFPHVTLVGILWADLNLHFPMFNASESTLQQLIQVAGRAGREHKKSTVIVQTMSEHDIFSYLSEHRYQQFYENECKKRQILSYPPYGRLVEIALIHKQETTVEKESTYIAHILKQYNDLIILGPSIPPIAKIKNYHKRTLYIKGRDIRVIAHAYQKITSGTFKSSIYYTPILQ
jgi:primosomal protein N' (replication factor Y) (superfamily II helicase)